MESPADAPRHEERQPDRNAAEEDVLIRRPGGIDSPERDPRAPGGIGTFSQRPAGTLSLAVPYLERDATQGRGDYADLKRLLVQRGLFSRQPAYYAFQALLILGLLGATLTLLILIEPLWLKLLTAALFAFVSTHLGFLGHDAGHRQIFSSPRRNDAALLFIGLLIGMSRSWWVDNHNRHHNNPNNLGLDPHTAIPALAFSEGEAEKRQGGARFLVKFQAFYFFPLLLLEGVGTRIASVQFLMGRKARYRSAEVLGMGLHFLLYFGFLFSVMNVWQASLFILVHQGLMGLYMGSVFAPNHKGMLVLEPDNRLDFLRRQVLTTRNVRPHPVTDFLCGGLNYQIEHHLFPGMPRNRLKEARQVVKAFCQERSIPYHETGLLQSYVEVTRALHQATRTLRTARR